MSWNVESVQQNVLWRELETCSASQTGTLQVTHAICYVAQLTNF
jgi:hypothetical protein